MTDTISVISSLISNLGFPIGVCVVMFFQYKKQAELHKDEIDKLSAAVNNNTSVMEKMLSHFEK